MMINNPACKFCKFDPKHAELRYGETMRSTVDQLTNGQWIELCKRVFEDGTVALFAAAEDYTDDYFPKFCPECGKRINLNIDRCNLEGGFT